MATIINLHNGKVKRVRNRFGGDKPAKYARSARIDSGNDRQRLNALRDRACDDHLFDLVLPADPAQLHLIGDPLVASAPLNGPVVLDSEDGSLEVTVSYVDGKAIAAHCRPLRGRW